MPDRGFNPKDEKDLSMTNLSTVKPVFEYFSVDTLRSAMTLGKIALEILLLNVLPDWLSWCVTHSHTNSDF